MSNFKSLLKTKQLDLKKFLLKMHKYLSYIRFTMHSIGPETNNRSDHTILLNETSTKILSLLSISFGDFSLDNIRTISKSIKKYDINTISVLLRETIHEYSPFERHPFDEFKKLIMTRNKSRDHSDIKKQYIFIMYNIIKKVLTHPNAYNMKEIGMELGGLDHSTIFHQNKVYLGHLEVYPEEQQYIKNILQTFFSKIFYQNHATKS